MTYQRFRARKIEWTPATLATVATVQDEIAPNVASVANVAGGGWPSPQRRTAIFEEPSPKTRAGAAAALGRHAATDNLSTASFADATADATGRDARSIRRDAESGEKAIDAELAMEAEERAAILKCDVGFPRQEAERQAFSRLPTPGITIRAPAIELSAIEYDRHMGALIHAAGVGTAEATKLAYAQRKGWVVPRDDHHVFTRGR